MEDLLSLPHIDAVHRRALRRLGRSEEFDADSIDIELVDAMARELHADRNVPTEVRKTVMRALVAPTPGGLQALGWLCRNDRVDPDAVLAFAGNLPVGPATEPALGEKESVEVVESVLKGCDLPRLGRLGVCVRLLASPLLSEAGRAAALKRILAGPWLNVGDRRTLVEWALGAEVLEEIAAGFSHSVPVAPAGLSRTALVCLVEQGEDLAVVVRYAIQHLPSWTEPKHVLQGLLDLVERHGPEMQAALRRQALDVCRRVSETVIRRRAYQLAARTESDEFLREALRDPDYGVRSWAMSRMNRGS